ncbi:MAG: glycosyltransferase [Gammaproteobacteria bacterium]|nr:glycosyltransferase [Gammaproteobacteria bacterium]
MSNRNNALIIFSKNPVEGKVKTRLVPEWGSEGALKIYKDLLKKTIETVKQSEISDIYIYCTPNLEDSYLQFCSSQYELKLELQKGKDLGERMANAIHDMTQKYSNVIIVGCDCPELSYKDINLAAEKLNVDFDLVLGPSEDGGYYLIGMNNYFPEVFQDIDWGTGSVLSETRRHISEQGLMVYELDTKWDLDRPEDVHRYFRSRQSGHLI